MKNLILFLTLFVLSISVKSQQTMTLNAPIVYNPTTGATTVDLSSCVTTPQFNIISSDLKVAQQNIANLQAGSGVVAQKTISGTIYTITTADAGGTLLFTNTCSVSFSGLPVNFRCLCHQEGGQITFNGLAKGMTKFAYYKSQTVGAWVEVIVTAKGVGLRGDLTK